jgi:hypothetical protein
MQDNDSSERPTFRRIPWNKGKLIGTKTAPAAETRLGDPDQAPDRATNA